VINFITSKEKQHEKNRKKDYGIDPHRRGRKGYILCGKPI
jgi:hypothetical protein